MAWAPGELGKSVSGTKSGENADHWSSVSRLGQSYYSHRLNRCIFYQPRNNNLIKMRIHIWQLDPRLQIPSAECVVWQHNWRAHIYYLEHKAGCDFVGFFDCCSSRLSTVARVLRDASWGARSERAGLLPFDLWYFSVFVLEGFCKRDNPEISGWHLPFCQILLVVSFASFLEDPWNVTQMPRYTLSP
jgi:hypothetical protein